jgi:serine/threonine protein kinase
MIKCLVLAVDESELSEGQEKLAIVLDRQISYFADEEGLDGLLRYLGPESPWCEIFRTVFSGFGKDKPRTPVALWEDEELDDDFKDLIIGLTNFDPTKRITASQALAHRWFQDV